MSPSERICSFSWRNGSTFQIWLISEERYRGHKPQSEPKPAVNWRVYYFPFHWPSNLVFIVTCVTYVPNLRKIRQNLPQKLPKTVSRSRNDRVFIRQGLQRRLHSRDGPKFGERRTSAEEFGRTFGSVRLSNVWTIRPNFGRTLAKTWRHICGSAFAAFCVNLKSLHFIVTIVYLLYLLVAYQVSK